jgi:hypothetical protein
MDKIEWKEYKSSGYYANISGEILGKSGEILKQQKINGKPYVSLHIKGKRKTISVAKVIIYSCLGISDLRGFEIHHKDKDINNNRLSNLEVLSIKEHVARHRIARGIRQREEITKREKRIIKELTVSNCKIRTLTGLSLRQIKRIKNE